MRLIKITILLLVLTGLTPAPLPAQTDAPGAAATAPRAEPAAEGLPPKATTVFNIGPFPVTNSMLVTWIVAAGVILFARRATRKMKEVPEGAQNFWELLVESLHDFLEEIVGAELVKKVLLVLCHHLHLHFLHQLVRLDPGRGHHRLGARHRPQALRSPGRGCAAATPI